MGKDRLYSIEDLEGILDKLPYEIWIKDKYGKHIYINELGAQKAGLSKDEIIGKTDFEFRNKYIAEKCLQTDLEVLNKNTDIFHEEKALEFGNERIYEVHKFVLKSGNICGNAKETSIQRNISYKLEKLSKDLLYESDYNYEDDIKDILNNLKDVFKCEFINLFLYDEELNKMNLYLTTNNIEKVFNKYIEIDINDEMTNVLDNEDLFNMNLLHKICEKSLNKNLIENSKVYSLKVADKLIGLLNICYDDLYKYSYNDEIFIKELCSKLSSSIMNFKYPSNLKKDYENILKENNELRNSIGLENMKINFLSNISHEFRTPINIINSTIQLLFFYIDKGTLKNNILKKNLNYIIQNSYRLLRLINNIMDTTKIDNGFYKFNFTNNNIISLIEEIVLSTVEYVNSNNIDIIFDTNEEELILACDLDSIERIMLNLIANALKFTNDNGKIEVNINVDRKKEKVFIAVRNTGDIISEEIAKEIFKKYIQGDNIYSRSTEGCGIGLYLSKYLIESHKGEIWVNTNYKEGAEFVFYIPMNRVKKEVKALKIESNSKIEKCSIEFSDIYSFKYK